MSRAEAGIARLPAADSEWVPPGRPAPPGRAVTALVLALPLVLAIAAGVVVRGPMVWVAAVVAVAEALWVIAQRRVLLAGAAPARADEHTRYVNIATGVSADLGMPVPRLLVVPASGANAFVVPGAIAVSNDLLGSYTRTELEAVVAHCLVRLRDRGLGWGVAAAAAGGAGSGVRVDRYVDARAAAVTRYPPALASAIRKAAPARGRAAALWFVADAPSHAPVDERVEELLDL